MPGEGGRREQRRTACLAARPGQSKVIGSPTITTNRQACTINATRLKYNRQYGLQRRTIDSNVIAQGGGQSADARPQLRDLRLQGGGLQWVGQVGGGAVVQRGRVRAHVAGKVASASAVNTRLRLAG